MDRCYHPLPKAQGDAMVRSRDFGADMLGLGLVSQGWENQGGEKVESRFDKEQGHQGVGEM